jgi:hypothetical protein
MGTADDVRAGPIVIVGLVGAILLFVLIVGLQALFLHAEEEQTYDKVTSASDDGIRDLRARQLGALHGYRYVDRAKGVVAIPVERAMELLAREASGKAPSGD